MKYLFLVFFLLCSATLLGQEICNDAIDNDGDGLVDLNDDDCICESIVPSGLIPNPSFEERTCCPTNKEQLYCANSWQQASGATTDYVHTCSGFLGHNGINNSAAPLPFPDGEGAVGFRDGEGNFSNIYKEYTGSVLLENMEVGKEYRFDFFVGFPNRPEHPSLEIAVFASTDSNAIPFGGNNNRIGCPLNVPNFTQLGVQKVSGTFEWVNVVFEFVADKPYSVIVLGPGCAVNPTVNANPYFFLDRLALAEQSEFEIPLSQVEGTVCDNNLVLTAPGDFSYQWYLDGEALVGEEGKTLSLDSSKPEGLYSVTMTSPDDCLLSQSYRVAFPPSLTEVQMGICEGETIEFGSQNLSAAGTFTEVFPVGVACDSTVSLTLEIYQPTEAELSVNLCPGDTYEIGSETYDSAGSYTAVLSNFYGCDSTVYLDLIAVPAVQQLVVDDTLFIDLGETVDIAPTTVSSDAVRFEWTSGGEIISTESGLLDLLPLENEAYQLSAYTENDCVTVREVTIIVDTEVKTFIPNVFSLSSSAPDNRFLVGSNAAITSVNELHIYDRWGNLIHLYSGAVSDYEGWDGRRNSKLVEQGVYTYLVEFQILDGRTVKEAGTVLVIR